MDRRAQRALVLLTAGLLAGCDARAHPSNDRGTGGASGHAPARMTASSSSEGGASGRAGAIDPNAGSGGAEVPNLLACGSTRCAATAPLTACCVDPATSTCGVED